MLTVRGDDLVAARAAALGRASDAEVMDRYVADQLSRTEAFGGVLGLFRAQYASTLRSVHAGLRAERRRSDRLGDGFATCHREFSAAEDRSVGSLRGVLSALGPLTGTVALGLRGHPGERMERLWDTGVGVSRSDDDVAGILTEVIVTATDLGAVADDTERYAAFAAEAGR